MLHQTLVNFRTGGRVVGQVIMLPGEWIHPINTYKTEIEEDERLLSVLTVVHSVEIGHCGVKGPGRPLELG
jgi:hypothetical protein